MESSRSVSTPIAPSTYYAHKVRQQSPQNQCRRWHHDAYLREQIRRIWDENFKVYGVRKMWRQLKRQSIDAARCTVARLMKQMGLRGTVRRKKAVTTIVTHGDEKLRDLVNRNFTANRPNTLWVADLTHVRIRQGFAYVAFVTDVYSRMIVGWQVSRSLHAGLALDALENALYARDVGDDLIRHSDLGSQYLSIRYGERLNEAGIKSSVGSVGDSYDNALAETINGLYKTELIRPQGPWLTVESVEFATLRWVDWFNNRRLLEPIGYVPPAEYELAYYRQQQGQAMVA